MPAPGRRGSDNFISWCQWPSKDSKKVSDSVTDPPLSDKVKFLLRSDSYPGAVDAVTSIETHMSWVFLAGDKAYKLKKAIQLPYLNFSTVEKREAACRAELVLNRRLAPNLYISVSPICKTPTGFQIGSGGAIVDWLVVMHRVDEGLMLDANILGHRTEQQRLRELENALFQFYRRARPVFATPTKYMTKWRNLVRANQKVLTNRRLNMPAGAVLTVQRAQRQFLERSGHLLLQRLRARKIVDGHGDLRPEHIWLGSPVSIIDCLEFNAEFRSVDPFDEISYLAVECERLGDARIGNQIGWKLMQMLPEPPSPEVLTFYRCFRATLRANLSIAHLLEPKPRTPEKWRPLALKYLEIARREALTLGQFLNKRASHPTVDCDAAGRSLAQTNRLRTQCRSSAWRHYPTNGKVERYR